METETPINILQNGFWFCVGMILDDHKVIMDSQPEATICFTFFWLLFRSPFKHLQKHESYDAESPEKLSLQGSL